MFQETMLMSSIIAEVIMSVHTRYMNVTHTYMNVCHVYRKKPLFEIHCKVSVNFELFDFTELLLCTSRS